MARQNPWNIYFGRTLNVKKQRGGRYVGIVRCGRCQINRRLVAWSIRGLVELAEKHGWLFRIGEAQPVWNKKFHTNIMTCPMVVWCGKCAHGKGANQNG